MAHYQTEQKRILLAYMRAHSEEAFTVEELCARMRRELEPSSVPGKSTVYRIMPELVESGLVKRFVKGNSRKFLYQMLCGEHCENHLHMRCSVCGKLYHMEDGESAELLLQVLRRHHFQIDGSRTVLLGQCESCGGRKPDELGRRKDETFGGAAGSASSGNGGAGHGSADLQGRDSGI